MSRHGDFSHLMSAADFLQREAVTNYDRNLMIAEDLLEHSLTTIDVEQ